MQSLSPDLSRKLNVFAFLGMVSVVYVHAFNFQDSYLWEARPFSEPLRVDTFLQTWLCNGLLRFGIPLFFFRAGILVGFTGEKRNWIGNVIRKARTLLVPYLSWSLLAILCRLVFEHFTQTRSWVEMAGLGPHSSSLVVDWSLSMWLETWIFQPVAFQLWFIRSLFFYALVSPLLVMLLRRFLRTTLVVLGLFWLLGLGPDMVPGGEGPFQVFFFLLRAVFPGEGLFFFCLGLAASLNPGFFSYRLNRNRIVGLFLLGMGLFAVKNANAFLREGDFALRFFLHKGAQAAWVLSLWFGYDVLARRWQPGRFFDRVYPLLIVAYGFHVPVLYFLTRGILGPDPAWSDRFWVFAGLPAGLILFSLFLGAVLRRYSRFLFNFLAGWR